MKLGYYLDLYYEMGKRIAITKPINSHCHLLLTGGSGSGKSYALLYLLGNVLKECPEIIVYFCDFKQSAEFSFLSGYPHYYSGGACYQGIMDYYKKFQDIRKSGKVTSRYLLICDEYPALLHYYMSLDKKKANDLLMRIAEILMMGRGLSFGCWIVTQRADAQLFQNGARDNFMVLIALGRLSKEQRTMLFSGEELPERVYQRGEGLILADGDSIHEIKIPMIANVSDWCFHILKVLRLGGISP